MVCTFDRWNEKMNRFTRALPKYLLDVVVIAVVVVLAACQDAGTGNLLPDNPFPVKGQTIEVVPSVAALVTTGERVQLSAHVRDALGKLISSPRVSWESADPTIASVDGSGMVTGMGEGVTEVKGTYGTLTATSTVAVSRRKLSGDGASVTIYPDADTVKLVGGSSKLLAVGRNNGGNLMSGNRLQWQSQGPDIATVDGNGVVTGLRSGQTQVIVKNGPVSDTAEVWVAPSDVAVMVRVTPSSASIGAVGESVQLSADVLNGSMDPIAGRDISWSSLDPSVATVSGGKVLGAAKGTARIVASNQTLSDTALVTVALTQAAVSLFVTPKADTLTQIGGTTQLKVTVLDANGQAMSTEGVSWGSLDPAVATVSSSGLVKAATAGQARITARLNALVDTAMIWVVPVTSTNYTVAVDPSIVKLGAVGDTIRLKATIKDGNGNAVTSSSALWASLDVQTASVSTAGPASNVLIKALGNGTARIVATYSGASDTATITIGSGGTTSGGSYSVAITPQPAEIPSIGQTVSLLWEVYDSTGTRIPEVYPTWTSLEPTIATVPPGPSRRATVTGTAAGTARIVTNWNGLVDTAMVVVKDGAPTGSYPAILVSPASASLNSIGATTQLSATAWDAQGNKVSSSQLTWSSLDPATVSVDASGLVKSLGTGTGRVRVAYSTVADTAWIWVSTASSGPVNTPAKLFPVLGPLVSRPSSQMTAMSKYDQRYQQVEYQRFQDFLAVEYDPQGAYLNANHYGGLRQRLSWAIRTGEPFGAGVTDESKYGYARGVHVVRRYLEWSSSASINYNVPVQNNTGLGDIEALYVLEGDPRAKMHIACSAAAVANEDPYGYIKLTNNNTGPRIPAVALQAVNAAIRLGLPYVSCPANGNLIVEQGYSWKSIGERIITWLDQYGGVRADGSVVATSNGSETYFMDAMLATELLRWHGFIAPHPRAYELATLIMDHVISDYYNKYKPLGWNTLPYLANSSGPASDLAAYYIWPSLVLWQETGNQKYYDFAIVNLQAANVAYIGGTKQFNQVYSTLGQDLEGLLAGNPWR